MLVLGVLWLVIEINISKVPTREFDISIAPTSFKGKLSLNVGIYCFLLRKNIVIYILLWIKKISSIIFLFHLSNCITKNPSQSAFGFGRTNPYTCSLLDAYTLAPKEPVYGLVCPDHVFGYVGIAWTDGNRWSYLASYVLWNKWNFLAIYIHFDGLRLEP